jgi:hypothetical protein
MAADVGKRLLGEVEETCMGEVSLWERRNIAAHRNMLMFFVVAFT